LWLRRPDADVAGYYRSSMHLKLLARRARPDADVAVIRDDQSLGHVHRLVRCRGARA
jgi:hypothetical protein